MTPRITSRGPVSEALRAALQNDPFSASDELARFSAETARALEAEPDLLTDEDLQLTLFLLYGLHYGDTVDADDEWEWNPDLLRTRRTIERAFERQLRDRIPLGDLPEPTADAVAAYLFDLTSEDAGPSLSRFLAKKATEEQAKEFVIHRSIYTRKEADPHSWAIPRLTGRPKAALVEVQSDEYGAGRPERIHAEIFGQTMRNLGLDDAYGAYIDQVPAITLASFTMMSMFGLNRSLRGAITGHLAAFEMTSSIPNRFYGNGFRRLGHGEDVTWYYDEHVEADAVHEQIAGRDLAGGLAEQHPELLPDIVFGAAACLYVDGLAGLHMLESFEAGRSSLREPAGVPA
ncbi:iron-containing redox enzyme family protein [Leifsonia sp. fls2-241-R2A-40a]|uniref:iron-containing redox enzyme family protein n=1 Tax=Leifsonia sp. fls2-241-R2A-40a TaxID=3040290 RepID=UPI00254E6A70|nr:iron-containing redox enzyme family protein [Leifsonia sp. fls2-241-R2A-40a]